MKFPRATYRVPRKRIYWTEIVSLVQLCYREDGGGPSEVVVQARTPNHHKLLWSKATVVSVMGKGEAVTSSGMC